MLVNKYSRSEFQFSVWGEFWRVKKRFQTELGEKLSKFCILLVGTIKNNCGHALSFDESLIFYIKNKKNIDVSLINISIRLKPKIMKFVEKENQDIENMWNNYYTTVW